MYVSLLMENDWCTFQLRRSKETEISTWIEGEGRGLTCKGGKKNTTIYTAYPAFALVLLISPFWILKLKKLFRKSALLNEGTMSCSCQLLRTTWMKISLEFIWKSAVQCTSYCTWPAKNYYYFLPRR